MVTDSRLVRKGDLFIAFQESDSTRIRSCRKSLRKEGAVCAIVQGLPPSADEAANRRTDCAPA